MHQIYLKASKNQAESFNRFNPFFLEMNKILSIIGLLFLFFACKNHKNPMGLSEEEFVNLLIDVHIADGTLAARQVYKNRSNYRPSYYYNSVYEKHGITPEEFDSCISYYSTNPQNFTRIYDRIIDSLNKLETKSQIEFREDRLNVDTINLWKRDDHWVVPNQGRPNLSFRVPLTDTGVYTITAMIRIFDQDQSKNPKMKAYLWKKDSTNRPVEALQDSVMIERDSSFQNYAIRIEHRDTTFTQLRGNFFGCDKQKKSFRQNYEIKNIKIFNPNIKPDTAEIEQEIKKYLVRDKITN